MTGPTPPPPRAPGEVMIEAHDLSKVFGSVRALDSVTVSARRGTVLALLGHNGAGKTTLVNILTASLPPTSGRASVAGFDVVRQPREIRRRIGLTGQFASVDGRLGGRDNLVLLARLLGADRRAAVARADELLELFALRRWPPAGPAPTPEDCAGASTSPPAWSAGPRSSSSTSRPPVWTRRAGSGSGRSWRASSPREPRWC